MLELIIIGVLYVLGLTAFRLLGGFGTAGDVFRQWGGASSRIE